jgi:hypothetical protein
VTAKVTPIRRKGQSMRVRAEPGWVVLDPGDAGGETWAFPVRQTEALCRAIGTVSATARLMAIEEQQSKPLPRNVVRLKDRRRRG